MPTRETFLYSFGRLCAVATRPACLFIANNYLAEASAQGMALAFLASSLALVVISADAHRAYYSRQFSEQPSASGFTFYVYVFSIVILASLGAVVVFAVVRWYGSSLPFAGVAALYFLSEKLSDELLRYRLFNKDFGGWGALSIMRSSLQAVGIGVITLSIPHSSPNWLAVAVLALSSFVVVAGKLPANLLRRMRNFRARFVVWMLARAAMTIARNWYLWATAVVGTSVAYVDRIVALGVEPAILPIFLLVVMSFSIIGMAVDFSFVSTHRQEFLRRQLRLKAALTNRRFVSSYATGLLLAAVGSIAVLTYSRNGDQFPLLFVGAIAVLHSSIAVAAIPQQIVYWSHRMALILRIEVSFWLLLGAASVAIVKAGGSSAQALATAAAICIVRCLVYVVTASSIADARE